MAQVEDLLIEASKLDPRDRAELAMSLLENLASNPYYVSDEEALERLQDLKSGRVKGLSEDEFWKACGRS
jgi:Putative addiction module component